MSEQSLYVNEAWTRTFVWKEMLECGFYLAPQSLFDYHDGQNELGRRLLAGSLPAVYASCGLDAAGLLDEIRQRDTFVWERLPGMLAFGYTQGRLIHELRRGVESVSESVALTASIFNTGIALFDYVVDELPAGRDLFRVVNPAWLAKLLDLSRSPSSDEVGNRMEHAGPVEKFLLTSIVAFTENSKRLYTSGSGKREWDFLRSSLDHLYQAEFTASTNYQAKTLSHDALIDALYRKSALPTTTIALISRLACPSASADGEQAILDVCDTLGRIFWLVDDLSDIAKDARTGLPSYVTLRSTVSDCAGSAVSIRDGITATVEDLCNLMRQLEDLLASPAVPDGVGDRILRFARASVYSWLTV